MERATESKDSGATMHIAVHGERLSIIKAITQPYKSHWARDLGGAIKTKRWYSIAGQVRPHLPRSFPVL